jgi:hypothetical protein
VKPHTTIPIEDSGIRVDLIIGDTAYDALIETRDLRSVRAAIVELARFVKQKEERHRGILILDDPMITEKRLLADWRNLETMFRREIFSRLLMVTYRDGIKLMSTGELSAQDEKIVVLEIDRERKRSSRTARRSSETYFDILRILINQWIKREGPLTTRWLCETAGCTYPTAALALERLGNYLLRHSDRRVELKAFPKDEWMRLVANSDKVRETHRFADYSGQPRSVDFLLSRFQKLQKQITPEGGSPTKFSREIAIGGVLGARRFFPNMDLVGTPRLDLTIHCRSRQPELDFIHRLDPALKPAGKDEAARVAIHTLRQAEVFFETDDAGVVWADPVECLLDLHEMRFESQALEAIESLPFTKGVAGE